MQRMSSRKRQVTNFVSDIYVQSADAAYILFPMEHCHFVNKSPIGSLSRRPQSQLNADYAQPQSNGPTVRYCGNVDIYSDDCNLSTHGRGVTDTSRWRESVSHDRSLRSLQATPSCARAKVEITVSGRMLHVSFPNVSR